VETRSASSFLGIPGGDHYHVYRCPRCGSRTTVYIGDITRFRDEDNKKLQRNMDDLSDNLKKLDQAAQSCFIATAAYGTPDEPQVLVLREFRDAHLSTNPLGQMLVGMYYTVSPPLAGLIAESPLARATVRVALQPAVQLAKVAVRRGSSCPDKKSKEE